MKRFEQYIPRKDVHRVKYRKYRTFYIEEYKPSFIELERIHQLDHSIKCSILIDWKSIFSTHEMDGYTKIEYFAPECILNMHYGIEWKRTEQESYITILVSQSNQEILRRIDNAKN